MTAHLLALVAQLSSFQSGLAQDANLLEKAFKALHPGLYRYNSPNKIRSEFTKLRQDWSKCTNLKEAYLTLSLFTAKVKCGHTYPNFFNQSKNVEHEVFSGLNRLPFYFRWLDGRMVVLRDMTARHVLPKGSEIEQIDGIPCPQILNRLMTIARADGSNDDKRRAYLSVAGDDTFEAFDIYFPLMFHLKEGSFHLQVKDLRGNTHTVTTEAQSMEDRTKEYAQMATKPGGDLWRLEIRNKTAILTMPTWELYNTSWDWRAFLGVTFQQIDSNRVTNLIVDLRGNEGGNSIATDVLSCLGAKPPTKPSYHLFSRYSSVDESLKPYVSSWTSEDFSALVGERKFLRAGGNFFYSLDKLAEDRDSQANPANPQFKGKLYVLVDGTNSSATFEFERLVQNLKRGLLVGEPTGGNLRGINGSRFFFLRLPNSHLEVDIPLVAEFPEKPQPDRGLVPDVVVYPTRAEIAAGEDAVLQQVMKRIERNETR